MSKALMWLVLALLASACGLQVATQSADAGSTLTARPTPTHTATPTTTATLYLSPTPTSEPTNTATNIPTPTTTPSPTPFGGGTPTPFGGGTGLIARTNYVPSEPEDPLMTIGTYDLYIQTPGESFARLTISLNRIREASGTKIVAINLLILSPDRTAVVIEACTEAEVYYRSISSITYNCLKYATYLASTDLATLVPLKFSRDNSTQWKWSPDSSKLLGLVYLGPNSELYVASKDGATIVNLSNSPEYDWDPFWLSDSQRIVWSPDNGETGLWVIDTATTAKQRVGAASLPTPFRITALDFSPNNDRIAFLGPDAKLYFAAADFSNATALDADFSQLTHVQWSPNGRWILLCCTSTGEYERNQGFIVEVETGGVQTITGPFAEDQSGFVLCGWSRDNHILYTAWSASANNRIVGLYDHVDQRTTATIAATLYPCQRYEVSGN